MRYLLTITLGCALAAPSLPAATALGGLTTAGPVWSNQTALPSGATVYTGDLIETGKDGLAVLSSPTVGRLEIRGESKAALGEGAVVLSEGVVAANKTAVRVGEFEVNADAGNAESWFVVAEQNGERIVAAYRGDVVVRGAAGSFVVPQGSFALAAAAPPPQAPAADDDDDDDKAAMKLPRTGGRAAGAGAKEGWSIGGLGQSASIAVVTGATAAAITGTAIALRDDSASPQD